MKSKKNVAPQKPAQKRLTPRELVNKRVHNADYIISDEDIKNVKLDPDPDEIKKKEDEKFKEVKGERGKSLPNPYSVLDE